MDSNVEREKDRDISHHWTKTTRVFGEEMKWHASWYTKNQDYFVSQNLYHQATMYQQFPVKVNVKIKFFEFYRSPSLHKLEKSELHQKKLEKTLFVSTEKNYCDEHVKRKLFVCLQTFTVQ